MSAWLVGAGLRWHWHEFRWHEIKIKNRKMEGPRPSICVARVYIVAQKQTRLHKSPVLSSL